ncbi:MAG: prepilin-type N-terminal cleavage/methylation domain-containing protein [Candidatus Parcubacteria bacterium]|nr:prepilin-type N-terminal cleavage/methylation domain-containing protein [Candidatus Parcubacteria bacterium]
MDKIPIKKKGGFTLVESLVAITVFLVVVTIAGGIYIGLVRQERRLYAFLKTENSIRFALDYMGRDIRMARSYDEFEDQNVFPYGGTSLTFVDYNRQDTTYEFREKGIFISRGAGGNSLSLLSDTIEVNYLKFYITNNTPGDKQPSVTISLEATDKNTGFKYSLETAVTPRNLNFEIP